MLRHAIVLRRYTSENTARVWGASPMRVVGLNQTRHYGDKKDVPSTMPKPEIKPTISNPTPPLMPGGLNANSPSPTQSVRETTVNSPGPSQPWPTKLVDSKPLGQVNKAEPAAVEQSSVSSTLNSAPQSHGGTPILRLTPKPRHRLRKIFLGLVLFTGISFTGGVYYSLKYDNFHDFFTEYIPFGEEAVLYFEEREFRKRFPNALSRLVPKKDETKVTITQRSGATWKLHEPEEHKLKTTDLAGVGPHIKSTGPAQTPKEIQPSLSQPLMATVIEERPLPLPNSSQKVEDAQHSVLGLPRQQSSSESSHTITTNVAKPGPKLDEVVVPEDSNAILKDLGGSLNSIIRLVNESDNAARFSSSINAAKGEIERIARQIVTTEHRAREEAQVRLKEQELEFAKAAQGILSRVDQEAEQINEMYQKRLDDLQEELSNTYNHKLQTELEKTKQIADQRLKNELLEQAIEMKRRWVAEIKDRVETERDGRLGKLKSLRGTLEDLEAITSNWADAVEASLKTQQLHIAVEAVRNVVEDDRQPQPFIRELAALKEVAENDEVVRAAIASINPAAYQKGVSSAAQLTDRFRIVSEEVRKAALLPESAGVAGHASSFILSKLLFKKKGLATGADVESILTRTGTYLEEGDLDNAAREMNGLDGWAKILATDWLRDARLLLEVKQALEVIRIQARLLSLRSL